MSKIFKLIKKYPAVHVEEGDCVFEASENANIFFPVKGGNGIHRKHIEPFPEFWENVTNQKYTIESYIDGFGNIFNKKGKIYTNGDVSYAPLYCAEYFYIHTIRNNHSGELLS